MGIHAIYRKVLQMPEAVIGSVNADVAITAWVVICGGVEAVAISAENPMTVEVEVFSGLNSRFKATFQYIDYVEVYPWPARHDHCLTSAWIKATTVATLGYRDTEQLLSGAVGRSDEMFAQGRF